MLGLKMNKGQLKDSVVEIKRGGGRGSIFESHTRKKAKKFFFDLKYKALSRTVYLGGMTGSTGGAYILFRGI